MGLGFKVAYMEHEIDTLNPEPWFKAYGLGLASREGTDLYHIRLWGLGLRVGNEAMVFSLGFRGLGYIQAPRHSPIGFRV